MVGRCEGAEEEDKTREEVCVCVCSAQTILYVIESEGGDKLVKDLHLLIPYTYYPSNDQVPHLQSQD